LVTPFLKRAHLANLEGRSQFIGRGKVVRAIEWCKGRAGRCIRTGMVSRTTILVGRNQMRTADRHHFAINPYPCV
jgi:hypothetical protein